MNDQEITILKQSPGSDPKIKRNSGLFSFLRWFKSSSRESVNSETQNSNSTSCDSLNSAGTAASFSFISPNAYTKNKVTDKCLTPSPETDTYKARLKQRDKVREKDKNLTLRKKYNLFFNRDTLKNNQNLIEEDSSKSLPLMTRKMEEEDRGHRRTNSDSSKTKKAGAYLHVKGKRKAPQPPIIKNSENTLSLRRKKRLAPQPPIISPQKVIETLHQAPTVEIIYNDSLKLDNGVLKPTKQKEIINQNNNNSNNNNVVKPTQVIEPQVSPRPWYKRNRDSGIGTKKENKYEPIEKFNPKKEEKRKSGLIYLTNISELDREAVEIIKKEKNHPVPLEMPEFMKPKPETNMDTLNTPKRKSAKDLIAKFNAITNVTKVTVNSAFFGARENSVFQKRDYFGRPVNKNEEKKNEFIPLARAETSACIIKPSTPKSEHKTWNCPKCNLENDYWRIICHVCSNIKPYFDDLTVPSTPKNKSPEKQVIVTKNPVGNQLERSKTQIEFSNKREEREKLKKMLIEMKNSLPKRKSTPGIVNRKSVIEENPEEEEKKNLDPNINKIDDKLKEIDKKIVRKEEEVKEIKPKKISSAVQTNPIVKKTESKNFQLMRPKDFEDIYSEKSGRPTATHLYANLAQNENLFLNVPKRFSEIKGGLEDGKDTLEINRLLRRLENAIAKGDLSDAAIYAKQLAQLKVNCSVIRQKPAEKNGEEFQSGFMVEMYVEDRLSHRGPFPIRVQETQTVFQLKKQVEREFEIPVAVQRWILGKELASSDSATLKDHNVTTNGCPVFLYLVAPTNPLNVKSSDKDEKQKNDKEIKEININLPEKKEINFPNTPRIVEEKFKPIEKIIDDKSKQILKLSQQELVQKKNPKQVTRKETEIVASSSGISKQPPKAEEEDFSEYDKTLKPKTWICTICTLINPITSNICLVCASFRPKLFKTPQKEMKNKLPTQNKHYQELMNLDSSDLVPNTEPFECLICLTEIPSKIGVTLRECLHQFCKNCLAHTIEFNDEVQVKCPFRDNQYSCDIALQDREIKALVKPTIYEQYLARSVTQAENKIGKSFHCKTPDCNGWCIFEDNVNEFRCPVCKKNNCLTCQAIHTGMNCKQYQEHMNAQAETDEDAKRTRIMLEEMVNKGEALTCPACQVILMKKWGCDWVRCSMCKTEICWVTRGLRWGPGGKGDTSGGCKCGVNGTKCHPQCNYCH